MIYLDNNATTRIDDEVLDAMLPYLKNEYGNASSLHHKLGRTAHQAIEKSRKNIANFLNVQPKEIFFTSGSTEAISTAIKGVYARYAQLGNHIITTQTEHKAVLSACESIEKKGANITYLPVDTDGNISLTDLKKAITKETILICIMSANNETGVVNPIESIAQICKNNNVIFFCDTTQSIGKQKIDLSKIPIDIACLSSHKFHGPKGVGALFIRRKSSPIQIEPLIVGGQQENGFRAGTYNVAGIVGLGKAIEIIDLSQKSTIGELRDYFEQRIVAEIEDCIVIAKNSSRIPNTSNILFKHVNSNELLAKINNIAISSGSACISSSRTPSHVLKAMQLNDDEALSCVRISLSKYTTKSDIENTILELKTTINAIRSNSPIWQMYKNGLLN